MEANYLVTPQLAINLSASYIDAEWKETLGAGITNPGESLTFAPKTNANIGVQYDFELSAYPIFARADMSYVGEYHSAPEGFGWETSGDYVNINLRVGMNVDEWSLALYATNLTDEANAINTLATFWERRQNPRTLGLEASYKF